MWDASERLIKGYSHKIGKCDAFTTYMWYKIGEIALVLLILLTILEYVI